MNEDTKGKAGSEDTTEENADTKEEEIDVQAFAEIISEKDKKLDELQGQINELKKANADMLLQISTQQKDSFDFDKAVLGFDTRVSS